MLQKVDEKLNKYLKLMIELTNRSSKEHNVYWLICSVSDPQTQEGGMFPSLNRNHLSPNGSKGGFKTFDQYIVYRQHPVVFPTLCWQTGRKFNFYAHTVGGAWNSHFQIEVLVSHWSAYIRSFHRVTWQVSSYKSSLQIRTVPIVRRNKHTLHKQ